MSNSLPFLIHNLERKFSAVLVGPARPQFQSDNVGLLHMCGVIKVHLRGWIVCPQHPQAHFHEAGYPQRMKNKPAMAGGRSFVRDHSERVIVLREMSHCEHGLRRKRAQRHRRTIVSRIVSIGPNQTQWFVLSRHSSLTACSHAMSALRFLCSLLPIRIYFRQTEGMPPVCTL